MSVLLSRSITAVAAWIAGAAISVAVGLLALSMVSDRISAIPVYPAAGDNVVAPGVMADDDQPSPAPPNPTPAARRSSTPGAPAPQPRGTRTGKPDRVVSSPGGAALARCRKGEAYLLSWSPLPGYHVQDVRRGPSQVAVVTFVSGRRTARMVVRCVDGEPQVTVDPSEMRQPPPQPEPEPKSPPRTEPPIDSRPGPAQFPPRAQ